jgi:AraC-like DNA-binding protein
MAAAHSQVTSMNEERVTYRSAGAIGVELMSACSRHSYHRHTHDTYGIGLIDSGGQSSWSGCGQVEAGPGAVITQNPGEVHDGRPVGHQARAWRMLYVEPSRVAAIVGDVMEAQDAEFEFAAPAFVNPVLAAEFNRTFRLLQGPCAVMRAETAMTKLFAVAADHSRLRRPSIGAIPSIERARELIDAQPAAKITLAELAQACSLTRFQLIRGFARQFGLTPHAYIVQRRLELSRRLLRAGTGISETALSAGFYDQAHLTRHFTRQFGISPGAYSRC